MGPFRLRGQSPGTGASGGREEVKTQRRTQCPAANQTARRPFKLRPPREPALLPVSCLGTLWTGSPRLRALQRGDVRVGGDVQVLPLLTTSAARAGVLSPGGLFCRPNSGLAEEGVPEGRAPRSASVGTGSWTSGLLRLALTGGVSPRRSALRGTFTARSRETTEESPGCSRLDCDLFFLSVLSSPL